MRNIFTLILLVLSWQSFANKRASEIYLDLQKLQSLKRVLYIAAHPDDENTRFLAYMSLGEKAETAYLSLTRGDGGQNLIGDELGAELGVLRTQELLAARSFDGAIQFFSKAVDFGYSKSAQESFEKWGKEDILADVVTIIREFRPDVIITRFPPDKRGGHGHHTASAMLAIEAFNKAADPDYMPEQVKQIGTSKTKSIYWNTSYWWMKDIADSVKKYPNRYLQMDIGGYNSMLGMSYNEVGTIARSQHKCQGFGAVIERGPRIEYFEYLDGERLEESFFEHNDKSWSLLIDQEFEADLNALVENFDFVHLEKNVEALLNVQKRLGELPESTFKNEKIALCNNIIINCLGIYIEVLSDNYFVAVDDSAHFELNVLNRSDYPMSLKSFRINDIQASVDGDENIKTELYSKSLSLLNKQELTTPYWLKEPFESTFKFDEENLGKPISNPTFDAIIILLINGQEITVNKRAEYKWRDPSYGERRREVVSTGLFATNFEDNLQLLKPGQKKKVRFSVQSFHDSINETLLIDKPAGWIVSPEKVQISLNNKEEEKWYEFELEATDKADNGTIQLKRSDNAITTDYHEVLYDHIPTQVLQSQANMKCVKLDAKILPGKVAYIKGVEDAVPLAIEQLGFEVQVFQVADLVHLDLSIYQSVVLGIRIYNVHPELVNHHEKLYDYMNEGGNVVMQYNTASRSLREMEFGPMPFKLSRDRVTEEDAEVNFLAPKHQILNSPNKITIGDFDNWVQERGLYFAGEWNEAYTPLFSWHDKGENSKEGALIVMKHGKGQFVYTGISFFRELPKGVVGAYRLYANILSYRHE
jgi:LmbE family N-acetylglucosaminyl deacetylase